MTSRKKAWRIIESPRTATCAPRRGFRKGSGVLGEAVEAAVLPVLRRPPGGPPFPRLRPRPASPKKCLPRRCGRAAAAAAAARSSLTVCVRAWWWCVCAVGFVVGGGAVFVLLLCGLCWRGGRAGGWWRWAGVGGGGHVTARVGWCVARGAAASWAGSLFVGFGGWWPCGADDVARGWRATPSGRTSSGVGWRW